MPFEPNDDVLAILNTLRESGMAWIADEIHDVIARGDARLDLADAPWERYTQQETQRYSAEQQIRITLETLRMYLVDLPNAWESSRNEFRETLRIEDIELYDADDQRIFVPFGEDYRARYESLSTLIFRALEP